MQNLRQNRAGYIVSFVFQALCFFGGLFSLGIYAIEGDEGALILGLVAQFFIGVVQIVAAIVGSACLGRYSQKFKHMYIGYWCAVAVYAILGAGMYAVDVHEDMLIVTWLASAWAIAIYFFVITIKQAFKKTTLPPLPHIDMPGYYELVGK